MFEYGVVQPNSVRNVTKNGEVTGFAFDSRIAYYRGLGVSMVEPFEIKVDGGDVIPAEKLTFSIGDKHWSFAELENDFESRWELLEEATVSVDMPGGLSAGEHELDVTEVLRVSYMPTAARRRKVSKVSVG